MRKIIFPVTFFLMLQPMIALAGGAGGAGQAVSTWLCLLCLLWVAVVISGFVFAVLHFRTRRRKWKRLSLATLKFHGILAVLYSVLALLLDDPKWLNFIVPMVLVLTLA